MFVYTIPFKVIVQIESNITNRSRVFSECNCIVYVVNSCRTSVCNDELTELLRDTEDSLLPLSLRRPPITHHDRLSSNVREMLSDLCLFRGSPESSSLERLTEKKTNKISKPNILTEPNNFVTKLIIIIMSEDSVMLEHKFLKQKQTILSNRAFFFF